MESLMFAWFVIVYCIVINLCYSTPNHDSTEKRIVGGSIPKRNKYPFFFQLTVKWTDRETFKTLMCGSTLIDEQFLLTAAHCVMAGANNKDQFRQRGNKILNKIK